MTRSCSLAITSLSAPAAPRQPRPINRANRARAVFVRRRTPTASRSSVRLLDLLKLRSSAGANSSPAGERLHEHDPVRRMGQPVAQQGASRVAYCRDVESGGLTPGEGNPQPLRRSLRTAISSGMMCSLLCSDLILRAACFDLERKLSGSRTRPAKRQGEAIGIIRRRNRRAAVVNELVDWAQFRSSPAPARTPSPRRATRRGCRAGSAPGKFRSAGAPPRSPAASGSPCGSKRLAMPCNGDSVSSNRVRRRES